MNFKKIASFGVLFLSMSNLHAITQDALAMQISNGVKGFSADRQTRKITTTNIPDSAIKFFEYDSNAVEKYTPASPATKAQIQKITADITIANGAVALKKDLEILQNTSKNLNSVEATNAIKSDIKRIQALLNNPTNTTILAKSNIDEYITGLRQQLNSLQTGQSLQFTGNKGSALSASFVDPKENDAQQISLLYYPVNNSFPDGLRIQHVATAFYPSGKPRPYNRATAEVRHLKNSDSNDRLVACIESQYFDQSATLPGSTKPLGDTNIAAMTGYIETPYFANIPTDASKPKPGQNYFCFIYNKSTGVPATIEAAPQQ